MSSSSSSSDDSSTSSDSDDAQHVQFFADKAFSITQIVARDEDGRNPLRRNLETTIERHGGTVSALIHAKCHVLIAGPTAFALHGTQRVRKARRRGVPIVTSAFVGACVAAQAIVAHTPFQWSEAAITAANAECAAAAIVAAAAAAAAGGGSAREAKRQQPQLTATTTDLGCCCVCHEPGGGEWEGRKITPANCPWCAGSCPLAAAAVGAAADAPRKAAKRARQTEEEVEVGVEAAGTSSRAAATIGRSPEEGRHPSIRSPSKKARKRRAARARAAEAKKREAEHLSNFKRQ